MDKLISSVEFIIPLPELTPKELLNEIIKEIIKDLFTIQPQFSYELINKNECKIKCEIIEEN